MNKKSDENTLDLHLLHVPEAIKETQAFLSERKKHKNRNKISSLKVKIVTGKGMHSVNGKPILKPSISFYLEKENYCFREVNSGMLEVTL